jgi:hypothetical protein
MFLVERSMDVPFVPISKQPLQYMWIRISTGWVWCRPQDRKVYHRCLWDLQSKATVPGVYAIQQLRIRPWVLVVVLGIGFIISVFISLQTINLHAALLLLCFHGFLCIVLSNPCVLHDDLLSCKRI